MANLTTPRRLRFGTIKMIEVQLATGEIAFENGIACLDTNGRAVRGKLATSLVCVGNFHDIVDAGLVGDNVKLVKVRLHREIAGAWLTNDGTNPVTIVGSLCYVFDDQTVRSLATGASVAGRVWAIDATKGVFVEFLQGG